MKKQLLYSIFIVISAIVLLSCISSDRNAKRTDKVNEKPMQVDDDKGSNMPMDYILIPLPQLIGRADLVIIGKVAEVGDSTFTFQVDELLLHEHPEHSLLVTKFIPSKFDGPRPLAYASGQTFALFLTKPEQDNQDHPWTIIGYTGEGEMPIENGFVYFEGSYVQGLERKSFDVQGVNRNIQRINLPDFKDAVQNYAECFSWELVKYIKNNKKRERWQATKICPDVAVLNYSAKSWMHDYLVRETINKITINPNE